MFNNILNQNNISSKKLILPTGNTPLELYKQIINRSIDLSNTETWNLDEYYPIEKSNPDSYNYYMWSNLFSNTNINPSNVHILNGSVDESKITKECELFSNQILNAPIDIAFVGVGVNGHVAFNEPGTDPKLNTRLVNLTESTKTINKIEYNQALSVGINEIYQSKKVIMMATGKSKAPVIKQLVDCWLNKTPTNEIPITNLITHTNFEVHVDSDAFSHVLNETNGEFSKFNKILILSPHPDDDVIGMGATIKKFIDNKKDVYVMYQTTGARGGDVETRKEESIKALKILGLDDSNKIIFGDSPFYNDRREPDLSDNQYLTNIFNSINPDVVFFAGDTQDPNRTHLKCWTIVNNVVKDLDVPAFNYYSAWYKPESYDVIEYFDQKTMDQKVESIKAHQSQINPKYHGNLNMEFYELAQERNKKDFVNSPDFYLEGFTKFKSGK